MKEIWTQIDGYFLEMNSKRCIIQDARLLRLCGRVSRIFTCREWETEVCEAERNWHGKSSHKLIGQHQENKANWFLWFRSRHMFDFSQREKNRLSIVQITDFFTLRFLSRKNVEKKFVLTSKNFFRNLNPIRRLCVARKPVWQVLWSTNAAWYLYSSKWSWIIKAVILEK